MVAMSGCRSGIGAQSATSPAVPTPTARAAFARSSPSAYHRLVASGVADRALDAMPHARAARFPDVTVVGDLPGHGLASVADRVSQAIRDVDGLRDKTFAGDLLVLAPRTSAEFARIYGTTNVDDVQGDTVFPKGERPYIMGNAGRRIEVVSGPGSTTSMAQVDSSTVSRDVLTHEVFHALTLTSAARQRLPLWLTEGFAEWAGSKFSSLPLTPKSARAALPSDSELTGDRAVNAYQMAAAFVRYLVTTYGTRKAMRFYTRAVAAPEGSVDQSARVTLGHSLHDLVVGWRHAYTPSH